MNKIYIFYQFPAYPYLLVGIVILSCVPVDGLEVVVDGV
jgi:hypothetical protein